MLTSDPPFLRLDSTLSRIFEGHAVRHGALQGFSTSPREPDKQVHGQVCHARLGGPGTPSGTTDANFGSVLILTGCQATKQYKLCRQCM